MTHPRRRRGLARRPCPSPGGTERSPQRSARAGARARARAEAARALRSQSALDHNWAAPSGKLQGPGAHSGVASTLDAGRRGSVHARAGSSASARPVGSRASRAAPRWSDHPITQAPDDRADLVGADRPTCDQPHAPRLHTPRFARLSTRPTSPAEARPSEATGVFPGRAQRALC